MPEQIFLRAYMSEDEVKSARVVVGGALALGVFIGLALGFVGAKAF